MEATSWGDAMMMMMKVCSGTDQIEIITGIETEAWIATVIEIGTVATSAEAIRAGLGAVEDAGGEEADTSIGADTRGRPRATSSGTNGCETSNNIL